MACDLKPSIERMTDTLRSIRQESCDALAISSAHTKDGQKYMCLSKAIGKIAVKVRDTMTVREYWYAKFVDEGVLVQPKGVK